MVIYTSVSGHTRSENIVNGPTHEIWILIAYASRECFDKPVQVRKSHVLVKILCENTLVDKQIFLLLIAYACRQACTNEQSRWSLDSSYIQNGDIYDRSGKV